MDLNVTFSNLEIDKSCRTYVSISGPLNIKTDKAAAYGPPKAGIGPYNFGALRDVEGPMKLETQGPDHGLIRD